MAYYKASEVIIKIFSVMKLHKRPLGLEELSFFARIPETYAKELLEILIKADAIIKKDERFILDLNKS